MHNDGVLKVVDNCIIYGDSVVMTPTLIVDKVDERWVLVKFGNRDEMHNCFSYMVECYENLISNQSFNNDLRLFDFDLSSLSIDTICSIMNTIICCTGHPILNYLINNDIESVNRELNEILKIHDF